MLKEIQKKKKRDNEATKQTYVERIIFLGVIKNKRGGGPMP